MPAITTKEFYIMLIKRVHPDRNPNVPDAVRKTQEVNSVKNNLNALIRLAIRWGFMKGTPPPERTRTRTRETQYWETITDLRFATYVIFKTGSYKVLGKTGVVILVQNINGGKFNGEKKYTIYVRGVGLFELKIRRKDLPKFFSKIYHSGMVYNPLYNEGVLYFNNIKQRTLDREHEKVKNIVRDIHRDIKTKKEYWETKQAEEEKKKWWRKRK
jgi:hypothetical protein